MLRKPTFRVVLSGFVFRPAPETFPIAIATALALGAVKAAWSGAYPGVAVSSAVRVVMPFASAWLLLRVSRPQPERAGS
jgi:hypothetical protein